LWLSIIVAPPPAIAQSQEEVSVKEPGPEPRSDSTDRSETVRSGPVPTLPPITVVGAAEDPASGRSVLAGEIIETLPENNGNINEMLRVLPGVQLSDRARPSFTAGEIRPPNVSIAGGKVFQNNFTIDGLSNNSLTDPTFEGESSQISLPGHPQAIFLDTDVVERITVYDHNVPAKYGDFVGGVVDTRTRDPLPELGGRVRFRTTSDRWTEVHVEKEDKEAFENSRSSAKQPRFEKHDGGATLNLPLGETAGLLGSYQILQSRIPLRHLDGHETEERRLQNVFLKYSRALGPDDLVSATGLYAPYEEDRIYKDARHGRYSIDTDSWQLSSEWRHGFEHAQLKVLAGYRLSEKDREGAPYLTVWKTTESRGWGAEGDSPDKSFEGGPGPLTSEERAWQLRTDLAFDTFATGAVEHTVKLGMDYQRVTGEIDRSADWLFSTATDFNIDQVVCAEDDDTCLPGEQYVSYQQLYPAGRVDASIDLYRLYLEDRLHLGRLELRPGLRFSYDDFMRNHNVAPRLAATLDLFGNGRTLLIGGYNRYYGKVLLAYKLREESRRFFRTRTYLDLTWGEFKPSQGYGFSKLDTPYSDEAVVGLDQLLLGGTARLRYIEREGKDEFAREYDRDSQTYFLNNNGHSRHREYRLSWERQWRRHFLSLNTTYQKTRSSNEDYSDSLDDAALEERIWYHGESKSITELPRKDFNRRWVGNLIYAVRLPRGVAFTNVTHYRGAYRALKDSGENIVLPDGTELDVYEEVKKSEAWLFDWKLDWQHRIFGDQLLVLSLEINNVFDRKLTVGDGSSHEFELGRQFWAGAEYHF